MPGPFDVLGFCGGGYNSYGNFNNYNFGNVLNSFGGGGGSGDLSGVLASFSGGGGYNYNSFGGFNGYGFNQPSVSPFVKTTGDIFAGATNIFGATSAVVGITGNLITLGRMLGIGKKTDPYAPQVPANNNGAYNPYMPNNPFGGGQNNDLASILNSFSGGGSSNAQYAGLSAGAAEFVKSYDKKYNLGGGGQYDFDLSSYDLYSGSANQGQINSVAERMVKLVFNGPVTAPVRSQFQPTSIPDIKDFTGPDAAKNHAAAQAALTKAENDYNQAVANFNSGGAAAYDTNTLRVEAEELMRQGVTQDQISKAAGKYLAGVVNSRTGAKDPNSAKTIGVQAMAKVDTMLGQIDWNRLPSTASNNGMYNFGGGSTNPSSVNVPALGNNPTGGGTAPTGGGSAPTGGGSAPTGGGSAPTGGGSAPTGGGSAPKGGGSAPTGGGSAPKGGGSSPKGGGSAPTGGGSAPSTPAPDVAAVKSKVEEALNALPAGLDSATVAAIRDKVKAAEDAIKAGTNANAYISNAIAKLNALKNAQNVDAAAKQKIDAAIAALQSMKS